MVVNKTERSQCHKLILDQPSHAEIQHSDLLMKII